MDVIPNAVNIRLDIGIKGVNKNRSPSGLNVSLCITTAGSGRTRAVPRDPVETVKGHYLRSEGRL